MARYLYSELASTLDAMKRCEANPSQWGEWAHKHAEIISELVKTYLPSGSGFDCGTQLDTDASHAEKLIFTTSFHHMNAGGCYDGWTEHTITVTPSLAFKFHLRVSGRNRNDIKDYIGEMFTSALLTEIQ